MPADRKVLGDHNVQAKAVALDDTTDDELARRLEVALIEETPKD